MIEITAGITSISAGSDPIGERQSRPQTGARVTVHFLHATALAAGQVVRAQYDFSGDGCLRTGTGIATPTRTDSRWGRPAVFHYRFSYWIEPAALLPTRRPDEPPGLEPAADRSPA